MRRRSEINLFEMLREPRRDDATSKNLADRRSRKDDSASPVSQNSPSAANPSTEEPHSAEDYKAAQSKISSAPGEPATEPKKWGLLARLGRGGDAAQPAANSPVAQLYADAGQPVPERHQNRVPAESASSSRGTSGKKTTSVSSEKTLESGRPGVEHKKAELSSAASGLPELDRRLQSGEGLAANFGNAAEGNTPSSQLHSSQWERVLNEEFSLRRITALVLIVGWMLSLWLGYATGVGSGEASIDRIDRRAINNWQQLESPSWAPLPVSLPKKAIREIKSDQPILLSGNSSGRDSEVADTAPGLIVLPSKGPFYVRICTLGNKVEGTEALLRYLDDKLGVQARIHRVSNGKLAIIGYFKSKREAQPYLRKVHALKTFQGTNFKNSRIVDAQ